MPALGRGSGHSCETEDRAALIILGKQCNLEVETIIPGDAFGSKAVQERAMDYTYVLNHFCTHRHSYLYEFSTDSCTLRFLSWTDL